MRKINVGRTKRQSRLFTVLFAVQCLSLSGAHGAAVFDGTVGPNSEGATRAGIFEIGQGDGEVAGNNLFQSFSSFSLSSGEQATFTHSAANIQHIIARVTGFQPTEIQGAMQVRRNSGGTLSPTSAALWMLNPNGIFIGDGASFDPQSTFVFSSANRLGFDNGDDFYSHETTISSELSIANPAGFGFLDQQDLPSGVTPRGIVLALSDVDSTNTPLLLSNMSLVGTSVDPDIAGVTVVGDITAAVDPTSPLAPGDSSQFQAFNLALGALAPGGVLAIDTSAGYTLSAAENVGLADIVIENSNLLFSDNAVVPVSRFSLLADRLLIQNSFISTFALLQPTDFSLRAISSMQLRGSVVQTATATLANAGTIRIDTSNYEQIGGLVSSRVLDLGAETGDSGNIIFGGSASLPMKDFLLRQGRIQTSSIGAGNAGDIVVLGTEDVSLLGTSGSRAFIASLADGLGDAGDLLLFGNRINAEFTDIFSSGSNFSAPGLISLQSGADGLYLHNTSLLGGFNVQGVGASIALLSAGDIALTTEAERAVISTGTGGGQDGGAILVAATGDLTLRGQFDITSNVLGEESEGGSGGEISLQGRSVLLEQTQGAANASNISSFTATAGRGADVSIVAEGTLTVSGEHAITSSTVGTGMAGAVVLRGDDIAVSAASPTTLSSSSLGVGDAGRVDMLAEGALFLSGVEVGSIAADQGAAGVIRASGSSIEIENATFSTATGANDINSSPGQITLEAGGELGVRESFLQSSTGALAPAGQVRMTAGTALTLDNVSVQSASTGDGASGSILVSSAGSVSIDGVDTELLTNSQGANDAGDVSIVAGDVLRFEGGGFVQTSAVGSGNAGTILLSADEVQLNWARIEGTSENAGGGDINIFGRDIYLDSDPASGGIVFITASSASSDADGNGGSITLGDPAAPADLVLVRNSGLTASANAGNGGLIDINAASFLRDARSVFQVTSTLGEEGSLEINSPEQDISAAVTELDVAILDATNLIQDRCAKSASGGSSLVITGHSTVPETDDDYLASPFVLSGTEDGGASLHSEGNPSAGMQLVLTQSWGSKCD